MSSVTWQWTVKDFVSNASKRCVESGPFVYDGHKVYLSADKRETDAGDQLGLLVHLPDCATLPPTIGIGLARKITLVHRQDRKLSISGLTGESASYFHSPSVLSRGWRFRCIDQISKPDSGFVSEDGAILVEVQLFPITSVSWEVPNFTMLTVMRESPTFTIAGTQWQVQLHPKGRGDGAKNFASAYLRNVTAKTWGNHSLQANWSLACLDENNCIRYKRTSSSIFSATSDSSGVDQWITLCAMNASSPILPDRALRVVANIDVGSIHWAIEGVMLSNLHRLEGPTVSIGGSKWKALASSTMGGVPGSKVAIALTSRDPHTCNGDFVLRPEFQVNLSGSTAALAADVNADDRLVENGTVSWSARVLPLPPAAAGPVNFKATFALSTEPSAVSWAIKDFRHLLAVAICPPVVQSGKIAVGCCEVELSVYPQGNGRGRYSHVSCFILVTPAVSSDVSPKMKLSFTVHRSSEKTRCVSIEEVVACKQPVGVARLLCLNDVEDFLGEDGELRIDVSWGHASSSPTPIPPSYEESDIDLLKHALAAEKRWRQIRGSREASSLLGELDGAAQILMSELSVPGAWEIPTHVADAIEASVDAWAALTLKQNEIRKLVAAGGDSSGTCAQRDEARRYFCKSVDDANGIEDMRLLCALRVKEILTLPVLEARFPRKSNAEIRDTAMEEGKEALKRWAEREAEWEEMLENAGNATDNAARQMRDALGSLFNPDSTALFDETKSQSRYCNFLTKLHEEERLQAECAASFPTEIVVEAYYATKEKATTAKKRLEELWEDRERAIIRKGEVERWLVKAPNAESLEQRDVERKRLEVKKTKLKLEYLELDLEASEEMRRSRKRRRLEANQRDGELGQGDPRRVAKKKSIDKKMQTLADALRKVDKARLKDLGDLWAIQQDHFPELTLLLEPSANEVAPLLSEHRQLDMYADRKCLRAGRHQIWRANFLGEPCVLKQFPIDAEMLREAKVQYRLRHAAVVPIQAVFRDTGASYIQLPFYKCDLAAWLLADTVDVDTVKNMVSSILHVVAHIHQCNFVHGDLKPRNFLVDDDSRLVLCDFGSSRTTIDAMGGTLATVTRVGGGTQGYLAPELAQDGSKPTKATDMYSIGCIILDDLLPRCSGASDDLTDIRRLATTFRSHQAKQRPTAMAALAEMTRRPLSDFPAYWKTKGGVISHIYDSTSYMEDHALRLLRESTTHTAEGGCSVKRLKEAVITKVERNENPVLFKDYLRKKEEIAERHRKSNNVMSPLALPLGEDKEWLIDPSVNECYLMHGTPVANVPKILEDGLNERVANFGGLYGVGLYFTSESCKAMQYCARPLLLHDPVEPGKEYCMLMCRVLVGDAYSTDKVFQPAPGAKDYQREPPTREDNKRWDSIIAVPGEKKTHDANQRHDQTHYETIIFDRTQIYPEFVIYFKVP